MLASGEWRVLEVTSWRPPAQARMPVTQKYGYDFPTSDPLKIELSMIRTGENLLFHFLEARKYLWPDRYEHRWTRLIYDEILKNEITILVGSGSSQKTSHAAEFVLIDYWCHADNTLVLVSTTTIEKLEQAIFGEIKMLFKEARKKHRWLAGNLIDHKHCIATDDLGEDEVRDLRKGVVGRPCFVGNQWVGLGVFAGVKQERIRFVADELQFMAPTFLGCLPNMFQNPDVKVIGSGNPRHDPDDQLGIAAEPESGWSSIGEPQKTTVWPLRGFNGVGVNLVGTDSPNFDVPKDKPIPYKGLINWRTAERVEKRWGKNSPEYYSQCKGVMKIGMAHQKVITRELCRQHKAHDEAVWMNETRTKIYGVDPAYGGGDRCIGICVEFGKDKDGQTILKVHTPHNIIIDLTDPRIPEEQIADSVFDHLVALGIPPGNCFYDAFGKGTIGFAFARKFGTNSPVPVDSGARPTKRPVRHDLYIFDEVKRIRRLLRCDEHYQKFVSELWFSTRYAIESEQIRELPEDVMIEGCTREYHTVAGNKIEVETKEDMRERLGRSPDLYDAFAISLEGARQKGFEILRLGPETGDEDDENTLDELGEKWQKTIERKRLTYAR